ncbi:MAG: nucleotidyl transferase AbiEii/AbiGii toxin family protein [Gemmatimonadetes bacterium]|nr:nucleotidyl transferase AbiEii/AbiGii toxin family protein [Gemmatimonadota bacterium]MBI2404140.1 nucleotidyl transferase AbiEii/AbiGii toxin family protein [Gemmatimonadota bacterium]MBI2616190.1 nucleotidyl transferase AbiEii/AbiGii toxin family protein [Gemmatimonadota bacterium]
MIPLAFQGGTALRFLFGLPRFSEDQPPHRPEGVAHIRRRRRQWLPFCLAHIPEVPRHPTTSVSGRAVTTGAWSSSDW